MTKSHEITSAPNGESGNGQKKLKSDGNVTFFKEKNTSAYMVCHVKFCTLYECWKFSLSIVNIKQYYPKTVKSTD